MELRISTGALLVIVAILVPIVVELRTALSWFGVELSVLESIGLGAALVLAVLLWAAWPPDGDADRGASESG